MKFLSLFSGIGGFELGILKAYELLCDADGSPNGGIKRDPPGNQKPGLLTTPGQTIGSPGGSTGQRSANFADPRPFCIGYSEIDKYALQIYQKHFPTHKNYGDITKINPDELPDFDLICGGFPCQSFSIAGKRGGFEDTRGTLFFDIARIIRVKRPRYFFLENVKGLISHDAGNTFATIIQTIDELGYDLQWQVLNSKHFGVPQNRERVFIIGHLRGTSRPQVFPIGEVDQNFETSLNQTRERVANALKAKQGSPDLENSYLIQRARGKNKGGKKKIAPTITGKSYQDNNLVGNVRKLTPVECERLQGFPDGWTEYGKTLAPAESNEGYYEEIKISDSQRYKCLGNAVTVNVIEAIMEKLL